jgi:hypothetical protein
MKKKILIIEIFFIIILFIFIVNALFSLQNAYSPKTYYFFDHLAWIPYGIQFILLYSKIGILTNLILYTILLSIPFLGLYFYQNKKYIVIHFILFILIIIHFILFIKFLPLLWGP